jgi:hypothetical protein
MIYWEKFFGWRNYGAFLEMIFIKKKNFDTLEKKEILTFWKGKF